MVFHFIRSLSVDPASVREGDALHGLSGQVRSSLPVIWHQCLLAFAQRYKNDITGEFPAFAVLSSFSYQFGISQRTRERLSWTYYVHTVTLQSGPKYAENFWPEEAEGFR